MNPIEAEGGVGWADLSLTQFLYDQIEEVARLSMELEPEVAFWGKIPVVNVLAAGFRFGGGAIQLALCSLGVTFTLATGFVSLFADTPSDLERRLLLREISVRMGMHAIGNLFRTFAELVPLVSTALLVTYDSLITETVWDYLPKGSLSYSIAIWLDKQSSKMTLDLYRLGVEAAEFESDLNYYGKIPGINIPIAALRFLFGTLEIFSSAFMIIPFDFYLPLSCFSDKRVDLFTPFDLVCRLFCNGFLNGVRTSIEIIPGLSTVVLGIWDPMMNHRSLVSYFPEGFEPPKNPFEKKEESTQLSIA